MTAPMLAVIVPTVLGIGLLLSLAVLARDAFERIRGPGWMSRRCGRQGVAAAATAMGVEPSRLPPSEAGLRSRTWYSTVGVALVVLAVYLTVGSWGNYAGWRDWLESIAWILSGFLAAAGAAGVLGVAALLVALRGVRHPAWVRPLLDRTPLGVAPQVSSTSTVVVHHPRHHRSSRPPSPVRPLGRAQVTDTAALVARTVAGTWTLIAVGALGWATLRGWMPATPEELDASIAHPIWIALYVVLLVSAVTVYRWELGGSVAMAMAAAGLAVMSSIQFRPWVAVVVGLVFGVAPFLHWLAWQRDHHVHHLARVAAATFLAVVGVWSGAGAVHSYYFGPTHPDSVVADPGRSPVVWAWAGGTTSRSTEVVARIRSQGRARLVVSRSSESEAGQASAVVEASPDDRGVVRFVVDGLEPDGRYHWAVEVDGVVDRIRAGSLRTMPEGPASFRLATGACARSGSNGAVFDAIRAREPLVYLQLGDLHYANIGTNSPGRFRDAFEQVLTAPGQAALYRSTSTAYLWDDHDYSANDGDSTSPSRPAAGSVYRAWVPSHPLVSGHPEGPIGQSFVVGRVRVVMTDTRSQRSPPGAMGERQHMFGADQEKWFVEELDAARDAGEVVVWATSSPWVGEPGPGQDTWAGHAEARRRVADAIVAADMKDRLVLLAGDAHMVAIDDGSNTDYSSTAAGGFPLLHAAALDRPGSVKGGPYSGGTYPGGGQFGEIDVHDSGGATIEVTLRGRTWDGLILAEQTFALPAGSPG
jgi:hypothetical protein